jgi:hypothetical protein
VAATVAAAAPAASVASAPSSSPAKKLALSLLSALLYPVAIFFVLTYVLLAFITASLITSCVWPSLLLAARLYETLPFAKSAFSSPAGPVRRAVGPVGAFFARLGFEAGHCTAVLGRVFTLPLRPALPSFYIAGLAKCGTTTLAAYLRRESGSASANGPRFVFPAGALPAPPDDAPESKLLSLAGLAEAAAKETHFLTGALGPRGPPSALLYRSFFPIFGGQAWWRYAFWRAAVARWLGAEAAEAASRQPVVVVVDATPTYAALPFVARRIRHLTPGARVAVVVRDPVDALASAEGMLRSLGAFGAAGKKGSGGWRLNEPTGDVEAGGSSSSSSSGSQDPRFADLHAASELWREMERLPVDAPIPEGIAKRMCALPESDGGGGGGDGRWAGLGGACEAAKAGPRIAHLVRVLGAENVMVVSFADLVESPARVVRDVVAFAAAGDGAGGVGGVGGAAVGAQKDQRVDEAAANNDGFRPLGARMAGGSGAAAAGKSGGDGARPAVHPTVRARLEREASFAASALLLGELTGVDPRVLLRRPGGKGLVGGGTS